MKLPVKSYRERYQKKASVYPDGCVRQTLIQPHVMVEVFTCPGGGCNAAFTRLKAYLCNHTYHCHLPRSYSPRWFGRLARSFDHEVWRDAMKREHMKYSPDRGSK